MSQPYDGWLPPLISHAPHQAHTTLQISQVKPHENHHKLGSSNRSILIPELTIDFEADIEFVSENEDNKDSFFNGLSIFTVIEAICEPDVAIDMILRHFPYLASEDGRITWEERLYKGEEDCSELSSPEEMIGQFSRFLFAMMRSGLSRYVIELKIMKKIAIHDDDLKSWVSWYDEKKKSDDDISSFEDAICRLRTRDELLSETVKPRRLVVDLDGFEASEVEKQSTESCVICMDTFSVGSNSNNLASKLPKCGHVFHRHCLEKWLKESKECPVCRSKVLLSSPSSDDVPKSKQEN